MASRSHKSRAMGGSMDGPEPKPYNAQGSDVEKEAEEKSRGGRTKRRDGGHVDGMHGKKRLDRPGRKRGGSVGADMHPLSSAAKVKDADGHTADEGNATEEGD